MDPKDLVQALRDAREAAGISSSDVAASLGVSRQALWRWETGSRRPPLEVIPRWADAVGMWADVVLARVSPEGMSNAQRRALSVAFETIGLLDDGQAESVAVMLRALAKQ